MTTPVLIIDDDPVVRATLKRILQAEGFEIAIAENGKRGLEMARQLAPRIVITDIIMPEKEGIETILELRKFANAPRIVAISGGARGGNADFLKVARQFGAEETLSKPFEPEDLVAAVRRQLAAA